jgi:hypothetical protein
LSNEGTATGSPAELRRMQPVPFRTLADGRRHDLIGVAIGYWEIRVPAYEEIAEPLYVSGLVALDADRRSAFENFWELKGFECISGGFVFVVGKFDDAKILIEPFHWSVSFRAALRRRSY